MFKKIGMSTRQKILTFAFFRTLKIHKTHQFPKFRRNILFGSKVSRIHSFFSKFKKVQWGNHYYDGLEFCDGSIIAIKPDHFNSLEIVAI